LQGYQLQMPAKVQGKAGREHRKPDEGAQCKRVDNRLHGQRVQRKYTREDAAEKQQQEHYLAMPFHKHHLLGYYLAAKILYFVLHSHS
ncbi:hypothetical protein, partial [Helicobacter typhlonius]|uniref:hypothetical protein n=1 Tax=Helicobacter typhlonius TaxID=76936 RepID=UPI002FDFEA9B